MIVLTPMVESSGVILPWLGLALDLYLLREPAGAQRRPFSMGWDFRFLAIGMGA